MATSERIGLFLGAGASYELGMPLVTHLTGEFKGYFTPTHLRDLNAGWRAQGGGYDDTVVDSIVAVLERNDLHYENVLGFLQTYSRPPHKFAQQYSDMYQRMVEIVALLLIHRQTRNLPYIRRGFPPFEGLAEFAKSAPPIWIFSLNHDLIVELLARQCGVPLRDGFWPEKTLAIPHIDAGGRVHDQIKASILSEEDLNKGNLHLFNFGESGINLLKLHGSLDVFTFRDGLDQCRLCPIGDELDGPLKALSIINDEIGRKLLASGVHAINEIVYLDDIGTMQFLRRTLLAGAQKFNTAYHQTLPHKILEIFRSHINNVQKLYVIGYSFGDTHIDLVLRTWLEFTEDRRMIVVRPGITSLPPYFAHLAPQIDTQALTASKFFAQYRREPMTKAQLAEQYLREKCRPRIEKRAAKKW